MRREPSSNRLKTNSSSRGSIYSRRLEAPAGNILGVEGADRKRKSPAGRSRHRNCRSCSCHCSSQNRCNCRRYSCCRDRGNRGCDNRGNLCCGNRGWNSCGSRYSNSLAAVGNLNSGSADNLNWGLADRRLPAGRRRGPGWQRQRDPGTGQRAQRLAASEQSLEPIYCILKMRM